MKGEQRDGTDTRPCGHSPAQPNVLRARIREGKLSEKGWNEFLAAEGISDWVVLHGGATAVFRVESLHKAVLLAEAITNIPGLADSGALLTLADNRVTVRLTRDIWSLEPKHIELARAASSIALEQQAFADRTAVQEVSTLR